MARRARRTPNPSPGLFDAPAGGSSDGGAAAPKGSGSARGRPSARGADAPAPPEGPRTRTVSELTAEIKALLEGTGRVAVEGELSGLKRPASGHVYFDLKDAAARISCAVWRSRAARAFPFEPEEGMQVVVHGKLDVYAPRGSYSLIVERVEPRGIGALLAELEALKEELRARGWFDRRRPLPHLPTCVGVVTSRDGAALRDFLRTRSLRWPGYPVRLCHSAVQGPGAAQEVADAIDRLDASGVDVIVVCRGGGSLEDLWAFNERPVAEAVWRARVPVVSGVGHESDTTLVDWVADLRAHTPTDAAQTVIPDRGALVAELERQGNYLVEAAEGVLARREERLQLLAGRPVLRGADWIVERRGELLASRAARLAGGLRGCLEAGTTRLQTLHTRLERQSPALRLERFAARLDAAGERLAVRMDRRLERTAERLGFLAAGLESYSPLKVLGRGYSLTRRVGDPAPLVSSKGLAPGDELETRFASGSVRSRVSEPPVDPGGGRPAPEEER